MENFDSERFMTIQVSSCITILKAPSTQRQYSTTFPDATYEVYSIHHNHGEFEGMLS